MKATPEEQALLLDLQAFDTRLQQLDHRARSLPELAQLKAIAEQVTALRATLTAQTGELEDVRIELKRVESDVELVEKRIARDTERLNASSSSKDAQALEQELTSLRRRLSDLEDIELAVMERLEEHEAVVASTQGEFDALAAQSAELERSRDASLAEIDADRRHVSANRSTVAAKVPAELLALYERQRSRYGVGASHLQGGASSASGVKLTEDDMQSIRRAAPDDVLLCPDSNAILVRTAESGL